ncbi:MAG: glycogen synthase GlgA [Gammaproteobacteria bacterium]|nr:glycogen synthase GlgA [Gammaproteobacteria bacterium]
MKILFASSEIYPLIKTGGLADVAGSLPTALRSMGDDVRLIMPAYGDAVAKAGKLKLVAKLGLIGGSVTLLQGCMPDTGVPLWLVDTPTFFDRPGNPYLNADGKPWADNAERFALFARAVLTVAQNRSGLNWKPEIIHCNDWQTGLIPALLYRQSKRPATVFTIHNLAYQGLFPYETFISLHLPASLWSYEALEFHRQLAFIKGGLAFADQISAVSPNYANEIQTAEYGNGLDGLLKYRRNDLTGIINGIDTETWNPATDPNLSQPYDANSLQDKALNKTALQRLMQLPQDSQAMLIGSIGRLVHQKGIDLLLQALPRLIEMPVQLVILGSGDPHYEDALREWLIKHPQQISVKAGYDEALAHQIEAAADVFLMPSRFEPCGLNQMYSLRYGTLPVVRMTGGLADTVIDTTPESLSAGTATGFCFHETESQSMLSALSRAIELYQDKDTWRILQQRGMGQDFSWKQSAQQYRELYQGLLRKYF